MNPNRILSYDFCLEAMTCWQVYDLRKNNLANRLWNKHLLVLDSCAWFGSSANVKVISRNIPWAERQPLQLAVGPIAASTPSLARTEETNGKHSLVCTSIWPFCWPAFCWFSACGSYTFPGSWWPHPCTLWNLEGKTGGDVTLGCLEISLGLSMALYDPWCLCLCLFLNIQERLEADVQFSSCYHLVSFTYASAIHWSQRWWFSCDQCGFMALGYHGVGADQQSGRNHMSAMTLWHLWKGKAMTRRPKSMVTTWRVMRLSVFLFIFLKWSMFVKVSYHYTILYRHTVTYVPSSNEWSWEKEFSTAFKM